MPTSLPILTRARRSRSSDNGKRRSDNRQQRSDNGQRRSDNGQRRSSAIFPENKIILSEEGPAEIKPFQYENLTAFVQSVYSSKSAKVSSSQNHLDQQNDFDQCFIAVNSILDLQKLTRKFKKDSSASWLFVRVDNYFKPSSDASPVYISFYKDQNGNIMQRLEGKIDIVYGRIFGELEGVLNTQPDNFLKSYLNRYDQHSGSFFKKLNDETFQSLYDEVVGSGFCIAENFKIVLFQLTLAKYFKERFDLFRNKGLIRDIETEAGNKLKLTLEQGICCQRIEKPSSDSTESKNQDGSKIIIQRQSLDDNKTPNVVFLKIKKYNLDGSLKNERNSRDLSDSLKNVYCYIKVTFDKFGKSEIDSENVYCCNASNPNVRTPIKISEIDSSLRKSLISDIRFSCPIRIESYWQELDGAKPNSPIRININEYEYIDNSFKICGESSNENSPRQSCDKNAIGVDEIVDNSKEVSMLQSSDINPDGTGCVHNSLGGLRGRTDNHLSPNLSPNSSLDGRRGNAESSKPDSKVSDLCVDRLQFRQALK